MYHRGGHERDHENGAKNYVTYGHPRTNFTVRKPLRKTALQRPIGDNRLDELNCNQKCQTCQSNHGPFGGHGCRLIAYTANIGLKRFNGSAIDINFVRTAFERCCQLFASQFQRALDRRNPLHGIIGQVTKQSTGNLYKTDRF